MEVPTAYWCSLKMIRLKNHLNLSSLLQRLIQKNSDHFRADPNLVTTIFVPNTKMVGYKKHVDRIDH